MLFICGVHIFLQKLAVTFTDKNKYIRQNKVLLYVVVLQTVLEFKSDRISSLTEWGSQERNMAAKLQS